MIWPPPEPQDTELTRHARFFPLHDASGQISPRAFIEVQLKDTRSNPGIVDWELSASFHTQPPDEKLQNDIPILRMSCTDIIEAMDIAFTGTGVLPAALRAVLYKFNFFYDDYCTLCESDSQRS